MGALATCNIGINLDAVQTLPFNWHAKVSVHSQISTLHGIGDDEVYRTSSTQVCENVLAYLGLAGVGSAIASSHGREYVNVRSNLRSGT